MEHSIEPPGEPGDDPGDAALRVLVTQYLDDGDLMAQVERRMLLGFADALNIGLARAESGTWRGAEHPPGITSSSATAWVIEEIVHEFATATGTPTRTMSARAHRVLDLIMLFPRTLTALRDAALPASFATLLAAIGGEITDSAHRAEFETRALALLEEREFTLSSWKVTLRALAEEITHPSFADRHQRAAAGRCVTASPRGDGMHELIVRAPSVLIAGALNRIQRTARAIKKHAADNPSSPDSRTIPQIEADVALDILLTGGVTGAPTGIDAVTARVMVTIPAAVIDAASDTEAPSGSHLIGFGAIDAGSARRLASCTATWGGAVIHPDTGVLITTMDRLPSRRQRDLLGVRDEHCRFPGCRTAAGHCEADHTVAWADGGRTGVDNLAMLCRKHHTLKHQTRWRVKQLGDGLLEWTSPLGRTYVDVPERLVRFRAT